MWVKVFFSVLEKKREKKSQTSRTSTLKCQISRVIITSVSTLLVNHLRCCW